MRGAAAAAPAAERSPPPAAACAAVAATTVAPTLAPAAAGGPRTLGARLVFIVGYGGSGTTLLAQLLRWIAGMLTAWQVIVSLVASGMSFSP